MSAVVILLPVIRIERYLEDEQGELRLDVEPGAAVRNGVELGNQRLQPSSDRRKVIELWRAREQREWAARRAALDDGADAA